MTTIFDLLGSSIFTPIKHDILFNIGRVREWQDKAPSPEISDTVQSLIKAELASGSHHAAEGLIWLVRTLDFIVHAFGADLTENKGVVTSEPKPPREVADLFRASYQLTLSQYHNVLIRQIFKAAMSATPRRRELYRRMTGEGVDPEVTRERLERYVAGLEKIVEILKTFLSSDDAKWEGMKC